MGELRIETENYKDDALLVKLHGSFEGFVASKYQLKLLGLVDTGEKKKIILDFKGVNYVDSAGIGIVVQMAKAASQRRVGLAILNVNERVKKILTVTQIANTIQMLYDLP